MRSSQIVNAVPESIAGFLSGADKVRNRGAIGLYSAVAHPSHAARMLDAIFVTEA